jgi:hypothetical protein
MNGFMLTTEDSMREENGAPYAVWIDISETEEGLGALCEIATLDEAIRFGKAYRQPHERYIEVTDYLGNTVYEKGYDEDR